MIDCSSMNGLRARIRFQLPSSSRFAHGLLCCVVGFVSSCFVLQGCTSALGAEDALDKLLKEVEVTGSLLDMAPFDIITLKKEASGRSVKVVTIDAFPNRVIPTSPKETDRIEVTVMLFLDRRYEVYWKDIEKITLFEHMVLQRAKKFVDEKKFGEAFEHLKFLMDNYPNTPGLQTMRQEFLFASAVEMRKLNRLPHTLAVLEELQRSFPNFRRDQVRNYITGVSSQLIKSYFDKQDLATARTMIERLARDYKDDPLPVVQEWRGKFLELAMTFRDSANREREAKDYLKARKSAQRMLEIEPSIEGGRELLRNILREYPVVRVGVFEATDTPDTAALANWPAFRAGQLISRPLFEFRSTGPEGGQYRFTLGSFQQSDDRLELDMMVQNPGMSGIPDSLSLSQALLRRATIGSNEYVPSWAAIMDSVSVIGPERLRVRFRRPHVLPQAFLQWPVSSTSQEASKIGVAYRFKQEDGPTRRYEWASPNPPVELQPVEIMETKYTDPKEAVNDLLKGEIEVIDRLFPADAKMLQSASIAKKITVENYALPTVHMLVPRRPNPYLDNREFRRALLYAINREGILRGEILGGRASDLSRVISGPFPKGATETDPIAYAYNNSVESQAYDPRLSKVLMFFTQKSLQMKYEKLKETVPKMPTFKLGVPNYEVARVAGQAIVEQWKIIGVSCELVVLDRIPGPKDESPVDILYLTAAVWEPATDAERLFGIGSPAETNNQFIVQALGQLSAGRNWREIRQSCQDLHALVASHLPILPLWQVEESFAYRSELIGVARKPLGLYQDLGKWRYQGQ